MSNGLALGLEHGPGISLAIEKAHLRVGVFVGELMGKCEDRLPAPLRGVSNADGSLY